VSLHVPQKWGPYGNRCPFPKPYLAHPLGSSVKEPSLQATLIELPRERCPTPRDLLHSFFKVLGV